jgi:hypothetical protein
VKIIEIIVSPTGETKLETRGFTGSSCREASRFLEQAMGVRGAEQITAEFHQTDQASQEIQQSR